MLFKLYVLYYDVTLWICLKQIFLPDDETVNFNFELQQEKNGNMHFTFKKFINVPAALTYEIVFSIINVDSFRNLDTVSTKFFQWKMPVKRNSFDSREKNSFFSRI